MGAKQNEVAGGGDLPARLAQLGALFQQSPAFVAVLRGPENVFEYVNDAYLQVVGRGRALLGKPLFEALPETRGQQFDVYLEEVRTTGTPLVFRGLPALIHRDAGSDPEFRYIDITYSAIVEDDGTRRAVIAHGTDVTDQVEARREAERLLLASERTRREAEHAKAEAEAANGAKAEFLAMMSHELRTPLNAIGGYAELLELGIRGPITDAQRADLQRIRASQQHLLGLVEEVLDLARIDSGQFQIDVAPVRAGDTVDAALALLRPQAITKAVRLTDQCDGTLDRVYLGDEPRVRQILVNLLANAVKFTSPGGQVSVTCGMRERQAADTAGSTNSPLLAIEVRDNGVGIQSDELGRIFEPFTQAEGGLTRPSGGTGLGLAISRRLARLMGGDITVESRVGVGSAFTLWLITPELRGADAGSSPGGPHRDRRAATAADAPRDGDTDARADGALMAAGAVAAGIGKIGEVLVGEVRPIMVAWVARLRADEAVPDTATRSDAELEDHAATFLTDVALALRTMGEAEGETAALLRDGTAILALIAERHGAQRARLGWRESAIDREFVLLREVVAETLRRVALSDTNAEVHQEASTTVAHLFEQGRRLSLAGYRLVSRAS